MDKKIAHKITSAESQFCVRSRNTSESLDCSFLSSEDDLPKLPKLPPFDCPTITPTATDFAEGTTELSEEVTSLSTSTTTEQVSSFVTNMKENQGCCGPGIIYVLMIIIILFVFLLIVICVQYRRKHKLHTKYNTSSGNGPLASDINKVEEANGTKIQNSAEAVPLKSHNWVGSTPNSSKPNIPQSQSAEPLGPSESASMVKTPSDPHLMVDEESQVQDLQTQPSQVELITKDEDLL